MEAETGGVLSQTKEHLGLPETGMGKEDPPTEASEGAYLCSHLDFRLLASRTVRE